MKHRLSHQGTRRIVELSHFIAHRDEMCAAYFNGALLSWGDLRCAKLTGRNFENATLNWIDFYGADLCGSSYRGAELNWIDFRRSNLDRTLWEGAELHSVQFSSNNVHCVPFETLQSWNACTVELDLEDYKALGLHGDGRACDP